MIELGQILNGLVQRTSEGKLKWSRTVQDDRFIATVDTVSVAIADTGWHPEAEETTYRLDILSESGQVVDSLGFHDSTGEQDRQMARLFVLARRSALDADSVLQKLAKGLEI